MAATTLALVAALAAPSAAAAATSISDHLNECPPYPGDDGHVDRICSGVVPSFDGSPIDVDLTLPSDPDADAADPKTRPLIVLLHGFAGDKHDWESRTDEGDGRDKWHWNNHWFAKHGYYVLTFTARGFDTNEPPPYAPNTPAASSKTLPSGTIQLKSREAEVRDTQWLAALVAAAYPAVDPARIAVSGNSYGGGESWVQASQPDWTFPNEQDSSLPVLRLQAAIPKYGWTDLAYSLAPHGHTGGPEGNDPYESSMGTPRSPTGSGFPIGTVKLSYVNAFYDLGLRDGLFESGTRTEPTAGTEGLINIHCWKTRFSDPASACPEPVSGDPYDVGGVEDPLVAQARRGLTEYRSSYYQDEQWESQTTGRKAGIYAVVGWTDDLFTAVEATRQFKDLKRRDPKWPVSIELADIGHPRAQNKPEQWQRVNTRAFEWLQSNITDPTREQQSVVSSEPTICPFDGEPDENDPAALRLTETTPEDLAKGTLEITYARGETTTHLGGADDPDGPNTDAVVSFFDVSDVCRKSVAERWPGRYTAISQPLPEARMQVGIGEVRLPYELVGGQTATMNARVWDIAPSGTTLLVTRGTYRIDVPAYDPPAGTLRLVLYGNHWPLKPGHRVRLDLAQVDQPTYRPSNVASSIVFGPPELELPTREASTLTLTGE